MQTFPLLSRRRTGRSRWLPGVLRLALAAGLLAAPIRRAGAAEAAATAPPVSVKELCLLLRSGFSGGEVLRDTAGRPLLEGLDADRERLLREAGADDAFLAALRNSRAVATSAQADAEHARQEQATRQRLTNWENDQARLRAAAQAQFEANQANRAEENRRLMARNLAGKLIVWRDQRIQPYDERLLAGKRQFALYFAALGDKRCRQFTPKLIRFYEENVRPHPEVEIILVSRDVSSMDQETQMRAGPMPWPALTYSRLAEEKELVALGQGELPRMLIVDSAGRLLVDSFVDGKYADPQNVLEAWGKALSSGTIPATH